MIKKLLLTGILTAGLIISGVACSTNDDAQPENQDANPAGIELTQQIDGTFISFADGDQVIIEHNGEEKYYLISGDVVGDLDTVKEGDSIAFSFGTNAEGALVLETLRLQ